MLALLNLANRPALVAIVLVLLCWLLLRPRPPRTARRTPSAGASAGAAASGARAVSVSTPGVLLSFRGGAPVVDDAAVAALLTLAATCDIYLVTQLESDSDAQEEAVMAALSAAGVFGPGACDRRKALVCATEDGRAAICRQLSPAAHLDTSRKARGRLAPCPPPASRPAWPLRHRHPPPPTRARQVASYLAPHVPSVVLIGADPPGGASSSAPPSARRAETRRPARASLWHPAVVRCRWRAAAAWSTTWPRGRRVAREAPSAPPVAVGRGPRGWRLVAASRQPTNFAVAAVRRSSGGRYPKRQRSAGSGSVRRSKCRARNAKRTRTFSLRRA